MINLKNRIKKLEIGLHTHVKYRGCELVKQVLSDGSVAHFCRFPDGRKELITGRKVSELEAIDDKISVEVVA